MRVGHALIAASPDFSVHAHVFFAQGVDVPRTCPYYRLTSAGSLLRERVAQPVEQLTFNQ